MYKRKHTKFIVEGKYVAEVEVEIIDTDEGWSPYISLDDALKLDNIRESLKKKDIKTAKKSAKVFTLSPIAA
jgi:hypothetical protein